MPTLKYTFKDLSKSTAEEIEQLATYNLQIQAETETVDGLLTERTKMINPEQSIINAVKTKERLFGEFLKQIKPEEKKEIEETKSKYDDFCQDVLDWARDNYISWIINLGLSEEHNAIKTYIDNNPRYKTFRQTKMIEKMKKWIKSGALEEIMLEKAKEKSKKK